MVLPDLNFTPPEEDNVYIPEGEHAGTLSTAKWKRICHIALGLLTSTKN
jgi:hypothetical protein